MSVIVYDNAVLLINGVEMQTALHELAMDSTAEMLDASVFGLVTRTHQAGLFMDKISGKAFMDSVVGAESVLFSEMTTPLGADNPLYTGGVAGAGAAIDEPALFVVFPDGVVAGGPLVGTGFVIKGVVSKFDLGGQVGTLAEIAFEAENAGTDR